MGCSICFKGPSADGQANHTNRHTAVRPLEPPRQGLRFLGLSRNWLALLVAGALLLLFGAYCDAPYSIWCHRHDPDDSSDVLNAAGAISPCTQAVAALASALGGRQDRVQGGVASAASAPSGQSRNGSACSRQADEWIIAHCCDGFQCQVAGPLDGPFVVLFQEQCADEADDGLVVGEDAADLCGA